MLVSRSAELYVHLEAVGTVFFSFIKSALACHCISKLALECIVHVFLAQIVMASLCFSI